MKGRRESNRGVSFERIERWACDERGMADGFAGCRRDVSAIVIA